MDKRKFYILFTIKMQKKLKGFTLVELLAAMAIIAILIGLAGFGISIALRNSRDSERRQVVDNLQLTISDYYTRESEYPTDAAYNDSDDTIVLEDASGEVVGDAVPVDGHTTPDSEETSSSGTVYHYQVTDEGYYLCVELENGDVFDLSSGGGDDCADASVIE